MNHSIYLSGSGQHRFSASELEATPLLNTLGPSIDKMCQKNRGYELEMLTIDADAQSSNVQTKWHTDMAKGDPVLRYVCTIPKDSKYMCATTVYAGPGHGYLQVRNGTASPVFNPYQRRVLEDEYNSTSYFGNDCEFVVHDDSVLHRSPCRIDFPELDDIQADYVLKNRVLIIVDLRQRQASAMPGPIIQRF